MRSLWSLIAALFGAGLLAVCATTPPPPRDLSTPATEFSAVRAMTDVREIARAPHPTGSAENARVRAWLVGRLESLGMVVRQTAAPMSARGAAALRKWSSAPVSPTIVNIVATLPGGPPGAKAVVLMAHYDSVWDSPGAADDGAGVAAALEIARAVRADPGRRRPLAIVFTDGEEIGLEGGEALFGRDPDRASIGTVVNLETRGGGGRAAMFETGRENGDMMRLFDRSVARPSATSLSVLIYELLPNSTDFTPGKKRGVPGFNFAFIGRPGLYHSPLATADNLDQGALQDIGAQSLDLVRALLAVRELPDKAPNLVFFDVFGWSLVAYPAVAGWLVIGAAAFLFAAAGWGSRVSLGEVARWAAAMLGLVVVAGALLFALNLLSGAGAGANYYDRLAAIPRLQVQALLIAAACVAGLSGFIGTARPGVAVGAALPLLLLGVVLQAIAPTAAFLVAWPLLLAGAGIAAVTFGRLFGAPVAIVTAALGVGYLLGFAFFLIQAVGPDMPWTVAVPLGLIAVLLWPLLPQPTRRTGLSVAAVLLVAAAGIALWVRLDPIADTVATYSLRG